jgi:hypothetical protein
MTLKQVMGVAIRDRGFCKTAEQLEVKPGVLGDMLRPDGFRKFDVGLLERYIKLTGDRTPIYYLVAKYCGAQRVAR